MYEYERLKNEVTRLRESIKEDEKIIEKLPEYLKKNQEYCLEICKKELSILEQELKKYEDLNENKN